MLFFPRMPKPELLAPAGSLLTFWAGYEAGADAFYLGGQAFNARKRAKNFSNEEIRDITAFCHRNGKKVYVTLNTLVFDSELEALTDFLELLEEYRADAVIVQDLGVLKLVRNHFPSLKIHASTQMFCHNSLGARFLKDQGVSRIVLPRELSIEEIGSIMEKVPMEYELFIHGAMCFSFSGCCLASSQLHQKSGNRGECRQVCRFPFETEKGKQYPFSMKDLDSRSVLPKILGLNPSSLKIEGRLKNADYVEKTVSAYRGLLDNGPLPIGGVKAAGALMDRAESGTGYFLSASYENLVRHEDAGNTGAPAGRVLSCKGDVLKFEPFQMLKKGMRLRVQDPEGLNVLEETLIDYEIKKDPNRVIFVWKLRTKVRFRGEPSSWKLFMLGESRAGNPWPLIQKEARLHKPLAIAVRGSWDNGTLTLGAGPHSRSFILAWDTARQEGLLKSHLEKLLRETDQHPFDVRTVALQVPDDLFIPLKELKAARREFYDFLAETVKAEEEALKEKRRPAIRAELEAIAGKYGSHPPPAEIDKFKEIILEKPAPRGKANPCLLPLFIPENKVRAWQNKITGMVKDGYKRFIVPGYGARLLFEKETPPDLVSGPYLYAANSLAFDFLVSLGFKEIALTPDIADDMLSSLSGYAGAARIAGMPAEFFVTRLKLPNKEYHKEGLSLKVEEFEDYSVISAS